MSKRKIILHSLAIVCFIVIGSINIEFMLFHISDLCFALYGLFLPILLLIIFARYGLKQFFGTIKSIYMKSPDPEKLEERKNVISFIRRGVLLISVISIFIALSFNMQDEFIFFTENMSIGQEILFLVADIFSPILCYLIAELFIFLPWKYFGCVYE